MKIREPYTSQSTQHQSIILDGRKSFRVIVESGSSYVSIPALRKEWDLGVKYTYSWISSVKQGSILVISIARDLVKEISCKIFLNFVTILLVICSGQSQFFW